MQAGWRDRCRQPAHRNSDPRQALRTPVRGKPGQTPRPKKEFEDAHRVITPRGSTQVTLIEPRHIFQPSEDIIQQHRLPRRLDLVLDVIVGSKTRSEKGDPKSREQNHADFDDLVDV